MISWSRAALPVPAAVAVAGMEALVVFLTLVVMMTVGEEEDLDMFLHLLHQNQLIIC